MLAAPSPKKHSVTPPSPWCLDGERDPERDRQMGADDRERSVGADGDVGEVHGAALATAQAAGLADDLGERPVGRRSHREHRAVPAVGAEHRVALAERPARADHHRLLALAQVRRPAHQTGREQSLDRLFERPDLPHPPQKCRSTVRRATGGLDAESGGVSRSCLREWWSLYSDNANDCTPRA